MNILLPFVYGLDGVWSSCLLPLIPGLLGFCAGTAIIQSNQSKRIVWRLVQLIAMNFFFCLGFAITFAILGAYATSIDSRLADFIPLLRRMAGIAIMGFAFSFLFEPGLVLGRHRDELQRVMAFTVGSAICFGWSPCVGTFLAGVYSKAAISGNRLEALGMLGAYGLSLCLPGLLLGSLIGLGIQQIARWPSMRRAMGALLFVGMTFFGLLVGLGKTRYLVSLLPQKMIDTSNSGG